MDEIGHNCCVVVSSDLGIVYNLINGNQHRGKEAAGIAGKKRDKTFRKGRIDVVKWKGPVTDFSLDHLHSLFPERFEYEYFIGHVRYATSNRKGPDEILEDAHPHVIGGEIYKKYNHTVVRDADAAIVLNGQSNYEKLCSLIDESSLKTKCDSEAFLHAYKNLSIGDLYKEIPGTYCAAVLDKDKSGVTIFRDKYGTKPLWKAEIDGKTAFSSENAAIDKYPNPNLSKKAISEVNPGEMIWIHDGNIETKKITNPELRFCFFEYNYVASPDSRFNGKSVASVVWDYGKILAENYKPDIDIVTYAPSRPESTARAYSEATGIPFEQIFYKKRKDRSFMGSTKEDREKSIKENLEIIDYMKLRGKKILVIDDSIVRGNVLRRISDLSKDAGAKIHLALFTPPLGVIKNGIKHYCPSGVDMAVDDDYIIRRHNSLDEIKKDYELESIHFISEKDIYRATGMPEEQLCTYCIGGQKPYDGLKEIRI